MHSTEDKMESISDHVEIKPEIEKKDEDNISIREEARGDDLPEGYFMSLQFIATVLVSMNAPVSALHC